MMFLEIVGLFVILIVIFLGIPLLVYLGRGDKNDFVLGLAMSVGILVFVISIVSILFFRSPEDFGYNKINKYMEMEVEE